MPYPPSSQGASRNVTLRMKAIVAKPKSTMMKNPIMIETGDTVTRKISRRINSFASLV